MRERTDLWKQRRGDQSPSGQFLAQGVRRSAVVHILVKVVVVDFVEVQRLNRRDRGGGTKVPRNGSQHSVCCFSIFAVCIVVDIAIVVVEGLEC